MKKIKIGYVSPDFRTHPVAHFFKPLILMHNRDQFEIYCYSNVSRPDDTTTYIKVGSDHWRNIYGMLDTDAVDQIKADKIDILVDLSGHTANNRLPVFALKPAPIQVTYLGYPNTTGLSTMDYRFTDNIADPPGLNDHLYTEKLIRLNGFLCYAGEPEQLASSISPCLKNGHITFGSFNNLPKVTPEVISLWSSILLSLPSSRLILKARQLADPHVKIRYRKMFKKYGISPKRITLLAMLPDAKDHLELYNEIDIALDPFPYNGTTTTCEALWMGVPVITLLGNNHAGRVGASILTQVGLTNLIATDIESYKEIVLDLRQAILCGGFNRSDLRNQVEASPLCNASTFTANVESAYMDMISTAAKQRKLHIGGETYQPGWEILNITPGEHVNHVGNAKDLPFKNNTFSKIYASHILEHFNYTTEIPSVLCEWYRVLQPGGKLYISVPDITQLSRLINSNISLDDRFYIMRMMFGGQIDEHDLHKTGLNKEFLEHFLLTTGFTNITVVDDFKIFNDTSTLKLHDTPISINITTEKPTNTANTTRVLTALKTIDIFPDDIFLVSYPRSGNTWLRFLLASIIHKPDLDFNLIEEYAPDIYKNYNNTLLESKNPRIIKSHEKYNSGYQNVIYLYRDVRDVIISHYFFTRKQSGDTIVDFDAYFNLFTTGTILDPRLNCGDWHENIQSWLYRHVTLVKYEDMLTNPEPIIRNILKHNNINYDDQAVPTAIARYNFNNLAKLEESAQGVNYLDKNRDIKFIRKGTTGQWKSVFKERHIDIIKERYGELLIKLGYEVNNDWGV